MLWVYRYDDMDVIGYSHFDGIFFIHFSSCFIFISILSPPFGCCCCCAPMGDGGTRLPSYSLHTKLPRDWRPSQPPDLLCKSNKRENGRKQDARLQPRKIIIKHTQPTGEKVIFFFWVRLTLFSDEYFIYVIYNTPRVYLNNNQMPNIPKKLYRTSIIGKL